MNYAKQSRADKNREARTKSKTPHKQENQMPL